MLAVGFGSSPNTLRNSSTTMNQSSPTAQKLITTASLPSRSASSPMLRYPHFWPHAFEQRGLKPSKRAFTATGRPSTAVARSPEARRFRTMESGLTVWREPRPLDPRVGVGLARDRPFPSLTSCPCSARGEAAADDLTAGGSAQAPPAQPPARPAHASASASAAAASDSLMPGSARTRAQIRPHSPPVPYRRPTSGANHEGNGSPAAGADEPVLDSSGPSTSRHFVLPGWQENHPIVSHRIPPHPTPH